MKKNIQKLQETPSSSPLPPPLVQENDLVRPTGIKELDTMLHGGFPSNATILLAGASGCGKTILSMQWLMEGYRLYQEPGMYISLTEPINKMVKTAQQLSFFKQEYLTPGKVFFEDLRTILHNLGLDSKEITVKDIDRIVDALSDLMYQCNAKRIVIDSITAIAYRLHDEHLIRTFIHQLDALLAQTQINLILTSEVTGEGYSIFGVEEFISDGILKLTREKQKEERVNRLYIIKMRGTDFDSHPASYRITTQGIRFYPRLLRDLTYHVSAKRIPTGIKGLDEMTNGGYFEGSSVLVTGSSGSGKSLLSLQFLLQGLKDGKKVMLVSFEESRDQIMRNAKGFNWDLETYEQQGKFKLISAYPEQKYLEEHIDMIRSEIETFGANLMVIDSLSSLGNVFMEDVVRDFVSRLNGYLKEKLVTTIYTHATATLLGANQITDAHLSTITDHIIMLRYVEIQSELRHALLILKMRGSNHDKKLKEIVFTPQGLEISGEFSGLEGVLSGSTHKVSESIEEQLHALFMETLGPMGEKIFHEEKTKGLTYESIKKLIDDLSNQGVVSVRRKEEFLTSAGLVYGKKPVSVYTGEKSEEKSENKKGVGQLFNILKGGETK
ncbi:hypothetical protein A2Z00_02055 [Candidatus Gottesmanbacteria bacterium RBG_13_45_10]|uniref:KaiC domain-containing protein n=1 Tax=Candidatus Gottesmanbacteria bacterium RBG_13_45_10 TaxID=1798370 RepID=A0A1F5ZIQ7_9BACT|nr:MAG: hypothetical protein A2Z00_02055 [Candidatus Gottesmanbacteria bacterium RBG_13_45_10]